LLRARLGNAREAAAKAVPKLNEALVAPEMTG